MSKTKGLKKRGFFLIGIICVFVLMSLITQRTFAASKPVLSKKSATICVGATSKIVVKNAPKGVKVTYKSLKAAIATVTKKGIVTGKRPGTTKIIITLSKKNYSKKLTYKVKVVKPAFKKKQISVNVGQSKVASLKYKPAKKAKAKYKWKSSNKKVVSVTNSGKITGVKKGTATVSVKVTVYKKTYTLKQKVSVKGTGGSDASQTVADDKKTKNGITKAEYKVAKKYDNVFCGIDKTNDDVATKIRSVYSKALAGKKAGDIKSVVKSNNAVEIVFASGIHYIYVPYQEGVRATGTDINMSIITMQPCYSEDSKGDKKNSTLGTDDAAKKAASALSNLTFNGDYNDGDVTLDRIKNIGPNQVILWEGHGAYTTTEGSVIITGEISNTANANQLSLDGVWSTNSMKLGVSGKYIESYCSNMDNSFIYLGTCNSGKDSKLADAFLKKGASAVVGNTGVITTGYGGHMMSDVIAGMCIKNNDTNNYNTLQQSMDAAKEKNGKNYKEWCTNNKYTVQNTSMEKTTPTIFGDKNFRLKLAPREELTQYVGESLDYFKTRFPEYTYSTQDGYERFGGRRYAVNECLNLNIETDSKGNVAAVYLTAYNNDFTFFDHKMLSSSDDVSAKLTSADYTAVTEGYSTVYYNKDKTRKAVPGTAQNKLSGFTFTIN